MSELKQIKRHHERQLKNMDKKLTMYQIHPDDVSWLINRVEELELEVNDWRDEAIKRKQVFETGSEKEFIRANDIIWLIEQAERALKNAEDLEIMDKQLVSEQKRVRKLEEENQRFKKALEFYADPMIWREGNRIKGNTFEMPLANNDNGHKARKALEGTDNE